MKNLKIGARLSLGFGILLVFMLVIGIYGLKTIQDVDKNLDHITQDVMVKIKQANDIAHNVNVIARGLRNIIIDLDPARRDEELKRIAECRKKAGELFSTLQKTVTEDKARVPVAKGADARRVYVEASEAYMDLVRSGRLDDAKTMLFTEIRRTQGAYLTALDDLIRVMDELAQEAEQSAAAEVNAARRLIIVLLVGSLGVSLALAFFSVRSITGPVRKTMALAEVMATGDFTRPLDIDQKDEIGAMVVSLNAMMARLRSMIREVIAGVDSLATSSGDLASVSRQLSSSARDTSTKAATVAAATEQMNANFHSVSAAMEQSSSNVHMVASAAEEMTATVSEIAHSAEKARSITESAVAQSRQASDKMATLGESARRIGRVTQVINEISEQTNLLALNATIEAARAGEAGKGFAVVANEIKELARQTASATGDIRDQIEEVQATAATSVLAIESISRVIAEINEVITGIATAVEEQSITTGDIASNISQASLGISEVNENVAQASCVVTDITRDIAAINVQSAQVGDGSGQVLESAQRLAELAAQLERLIKQFKV